MIKSLRQDFESLVSAEKGTKSTTRWNLVFTTVWSNIIILGTWFVMNVHLMLDATKTKQIQVLDIPMGVVWIYFAANGVAGALTAANKIFGEKKEPCPTEEKKER
jgi:hypothetical protein